MKIVYVKENKLKTKKECYYLTLSNKQQRDKICILRNQKQKNQMFTLEVSWRLRFPLLCLNAPYFKWFQLAQYNKYFVTETPYTLFIHAAYFACKLNILHNFE